MTRQVEPGCLVPVRESTEIKAPTAELNYLLKDFNLVDISAPKQVVFTDKLLCCWNPASVSEGFI